MRNILIIFAILLLLLTLLGTFGGSLRYNEPFYDKPKSDIIYNYGVDVPKKVKSYFVSDPASAFLTSPVSPISPISPASASPTISHAPTSLIFPPSPTFPVSHAPASPISHSASTAYPIAPISKPHSKIMENEGFDIEPFEADSNNLPADY